MKKENYYHINQNSNYFLTPVDIGHSIDQSWNVNENYPFYSLNFMVKGTAYYYLNNKEYVINSGCLFIVPPNTDVHYMNKNNELIELYWINFNGLNVKTLLSKIDFEEAYILKINDAKAFTNLLKQTMIIMSKTKTKDVSGLACLYNVFDLLTREHPLTAPSSDDRPIRFQEVLEKIDEKKFNPDITEKEMARHCYMSKEHFSRIFKKNMSMTFITYINMERIKKASEFLEKTSMSVKDISYSIGYSNVYYFCRVFKKYRLLTPTNYRNKNKSN